MIVLFASYPQLIHFFQMTYHPFQTSRFVSLAVNLRAEGRMNLSKCRFIPPSIPSLAELLLERIRKKFLNPVPKKLPQAKIGLR